MRRKRLIVIYYTGPGSENLTNDDYKDFYLPVKASLDPNKNLTMEDVHCPDVKSLVSKIAELTNARDRLEELYLHFSGHGTVAGIPYANWTIANDNFAALLKHPKIKFCFFSSCKSAELSKLVSDSNIPAVIGTAGDNDIKNRYAIDFQNIFYQRIIQSSTFEVAYKAAVATANQNHNKFKGLDIITRGESGGAIIARTPMNELQLFVTKDEEKFQFVLPPDWVMEMNQVGHDKPWCLNWFDDTVEGDLFYEKLEGEGLQEIFNWQDIPTPELYLLKDRANDDDPLAVGQIKLIFHFSKAELVPEEIRSFIENKQLVDAKGVSVIFCIKEELDRRMLFRDRNMPESYPKSKTFEFRNHSSELIGYDKFIAALDNNEIPNTKRREIVLNFESRPFKKQLYEVRGTTEIKGFAKVFFAQTINDRLINFLVNWIKTCKVKGSISFVADNLPNLELNLLLDLEQQLQKHFSDDKRLAAQIRRLYDLKGIIILRNRSKDPSTGYTIVKELLEYLAKAVNIYELEDDPPELTAVKSPILFFILNEGGFQEPVSPSNRIWLKSFSGHEPIDETMIKSWAENYSPVSSETEAVVAKVSEVAAVIKPQADPIACPSIVIETICNHFNIPLQNVLNL